MSVITTWPLPYLLCTNIHHKDKTWSLITSALWIIVCLLGHPCGSQQEWEKSPLECKKTTKGAEYRGALSFTEHGLPCQRWDSQSPHAHSYINEYLFPDRNLTSAGAHCRNPAGIKGRPWCFTTVPGVRWQYCDIANCGCRKSKAGWDYTGKISVTLSGRRCQKWTAQEPHAQSYSELSAFPDPTIEDAGDNCRNPDRWEVKGPWCYTVDPQVRWEYCNVPYCECKVSPGGHQYGGKISRTRSGLRCQRWDSQIPHAHRYLEKACAFPEESVSNAANHCRNPEPNELGGPWCFTTDPDIRWEYCDIPLCGQDIEVIPIGNDSQPLNDIDPAIRDGISRVELIFLGLFAASLLLTITTIGAAIVVVHVYRKRHSDRACASCQKNVAVTIRENQANVETWTKHKRRNQYEHGDFGDTVYIEHHGSMDSDIAAHAHHTYDTISSASKSELDQWASGDDRCLSGTSGANRLTVAKRDSSAHGNMYENARFHVLITPKSGHKELKFERRSSIS